LLGFVKIINLLNNLISNVMHKLIGLKTGLKFAFFIAVLALVIAAVVLNNLITGGGPKALTEAMEGGESVLTAIGRSHESLTNFMKNNEQLAEELLKVAQTSQENAKAKLTFARHTDDDFVINMAENYGILLDSSHVLTRGLDNLLAITDDLKKAFGYYEQGAYEEAAEKASVCLQTLTPLVKQFNLWNRSLDSINYGYVASGHRDRVKHAVVEYRDENRIYLEYILLLESIMEGVNYLNAMDAINELFDQLQHAVANKDYENARDFLEEISEQLQLLEDPQYQNAASTASELDQSLLDGEAFNIAQDVKDQLKDLEGIQGFENYLESVRRYMEALSYFEQGDLEAAEEAIGRGLSLLGQGESLTDAQIQRFYTALRGAFNSLTTQMRTSGQLDQG